MGVIDDLASIARQERELAFGRFDEDVAWTLGSLIRERARAEAWPVVVEVWSFGRPLFVSVAPAPPSEA